jgi:hypothetical protein
MWFVCDQQNMNAAFKMTGRYFMLFIVCVCVCVCVWCVCECVCLSASCYSIAHDTGMHANSKRHAGTIILILRTDEPREYHA